MKVTWSSILRRLLLSVIGFGAGLGCSFLFYEFIVVELNFHDSYKMILLGNTAVFLSIGFGVSDQVRCITCLALPEFGSVAGKRFIQASIIILVLAGPVENIGTNGRQVLHLVTCFKELTVNITIAGRDLILAPIQHIIYELKSEDIQSNYNFTEMNEMVKPISTELEDNSETQKLKKNNDLEDKVMTHQRRSKKLEKAYRVRSSDTDGQEIEKRYKKKLAYRCEDIFTRGTQKCKEIFSNKFDDCAEAVTWVLKWILCWPMKLTFICDVIGMFSQDKLCDLAGLVPEGFGENYLTGKKGIDDFTKKFKVKIDYQGLTKFVNIDKIDLHKEEALEAFERGQRYIEYYMDLVKRTLAFTFLFMIFSALSYNRSYFDNLSHDNCYITKYFVKVDKRRVGRGKEGVLPLKSYEKSKFTTVFRIRLRGDETRRFIVQIILMTVQGLIVFTIFAFDYLFTRLLQLIENHVDITFHQTGVHALHFNINGVGFIARLLRRVVSDFNFHHDLDIQHFTKPCLPNPSILHKAYIYRTLILFGVLFLIAYLQAFSVRVRHCIANFFYPKRSKARILWLFNETRRKRAGKLIQLKEQVLENADDQRSRVNFNPVVALRETFPKACRCLQFMKCSKRKCVLCKKSGEAFRCPKCKFSYCSECYSDVDERCLYCIARAELMESMYDEKNNDDDRVV